ncbi:MAG TPA: CHASE2 domain-containing protein [Solirubrobacteraceae bacterium]|nr:CHASE2 domain-containing protein [Solirubrobacteraceae bacterium]
MSAARHPTNRPWRGARDAAHAWLLVGVAMLAAGVGVVGLLTGAWNAIEHATVNARFSLRPAHQLHNLVVVAIDDRTLESLDRHWPLPRSLDARAIEVLRREQARTIVYDAQSIKLTSEARDPDLYEAVSRARNVVLATTEVGPLADTDVLRGEGSPGRAQVRVGAANFPTNSSGVIQQYPYSVGALHSVAVAAVESATGRAVPSSSFSDGSAWIDFPGPVGTVPSVSFVDLIRGRVPAAQIAGKIVVVGATSAALQDIHATSVTSSTGMSGPEVQAAAIATAMAGNPLREASLWVGLIITLLAGLATPLSCLTMRPARALVMGAGMAAAYAVLAQVAFGQGLILPVSYPLVALAIGTLGALLVSYLAETWERELSDRYGAVLEDTVRERTAELYDTQVELIRRLAQAAELRDDDTGAHIDRVGRLCERVALRVGMAPREAERLRIASTLHDVGKIGVADRVLLKRGELDSEEWDAMMAHTTTGASLLSGSGSPLLQMAEVIARTHHERWDGTGYPEGLKGEQIPLVGRICAICDVFDALASRRSYKDPWAFDRVVREIERKRGSHFDPRVVDAFLKVIDEFRDEAWDAPGEAPPAAAGDRAGMPAAHSEPDVQEGAIAVRAMGTPQGAGRGHRDGRVPR